MTYRAVDTAIWSDPFIESLSPMAKLIFVYLWTNSACNQAGLYVISKQRIEFETGAELTPEIISALKPKIEIDLKKNIVWVKNFFRRQCANQSFAIGALKCLASICVEFHPYFLKHNEKLIKKHKLRIEDYLSDTVHTGCIDGVVTVKKDVDTHPTSDQIRSDQISSVKKSVSSTPLKNIKKRNFEEKTRILTETIIDKCESILKLPKKDGKKFNPYQFVQASINNSIHPSAIVDALEKIKKQWDIISNPWTYGNKITKVESGNYCEREHAAESEAFKQNLECNDEIMGLIRGIGG